MELLQYEWTIEGVDYVDLHRLGSVAVKSDIAETIGEPKYTARSTEEGKRFFTVT